MLTDPVFLTPDLDVLTTASALRDPPGPQGQFVLLVYCLQFSTHKNTPVSRIVYASRIYYPLLYGSIVSYRRAHRKSPLVLTLTVVAPIHKILFFICSTKEEKIDAARSVVSRYYGDTPIKLLEYLVNKNELIKNEEQFEAFIVYINSLFFEMKYRLGFDFKKDSLPEFTLNLKTSTTPSSSPPGGIIVSTDKDGNTIISAKIEKRKISKNKKDEPIGQSQQCYSE